MSGTRFGPLNFTILACYLGFMLLLGAVLARRQKNTEDFFLAGRRMPWIVVAMSMYASLTSAVTYMGLPSMAYSENVAMLVVCFISPILAPCLIWIFYPFYQHLKVTTSYEYIGLRYGPSGRYASGTFFILARMGWLGTVVYAPAVAMAVATGLPLRTTILLMGSIATAYTVLGGVAADIWSDVIQFLIMVAGAGWLVVTLLQSVPGGAAGILALAHETGHLHILDWNLDLYKMTGLVVAVSFFFQMMQDYGTDQTTVQRLMATPTLKGIARAILFNAVFDSLLIGALLFIGIGMFAYYDHHPGLLPEGISADHVLPYYILHALPNGVSGLLVTAIFAAAMSSMDSGISSLATVVVNDFVEPLRKAKPKPEGHDLFLARVLTLVFGACATMTAFYVASFEHIIHAYTTIISLFSGPVLALFLLGMLTRRGRFAGWLVGVAVSIPATLWLQYVVKTHWTYFFPCSFGLSMGVGYMVSRLLPRRSPRPGLTLWDRHT
jgi:SSS family solute:Na+ symporter